MSILESSYFVFSAALTTDVYLAGSSSPCGSCMTRTHTLRVLCALRRPIRRARLNDVLDATPYGPHHDYHRLPLFLHIAMGYLRRILYIDLGMVIIYRTSMNAPESNFEES